MDGLCMCYSLELWGRYVACPLQSPIFGYLWGTSIPWFRVPRGYPFQGGKGAPCQYHSTMEWKSHPIPHSYQYHVTYHTIRGVWGPFTKYEKYFYRLQYLSIGLHLLWTGSSHFCHHFKLQVEAIGWVWSFENQLNWAWSQVLAIYTLDNPSQATQNWISCQAIWLANYSSQINHTASTTTVWPVKIKENKTFVYWLSVINIPRLYLL